MEHSFWHNCWETNKIAFHQAKPHKLLTQYFATHALSKDSRVFVPLCGKSLDMLWFMSQGVGVVGCELSEIAVKQFFDENKLVYEVKQINGFAVYSNELCTIYCGDIFNLTKDMLGNIDLVYDRAALIALPPDLRETYVAHMKELMNQDTQILLIAIDYDAKDFSGPPFAINEQMVRKIYFDNCNVEKLMQVDELSAIGSRMHNAGIFELTESFYRITK